MTTSHRRTYVSLVLMFAATFILSNAVSWVPAKSQQVPLEAVTITVTSISQTTIQPTVVTTQTVITMQSYLPQGSMEVLAFFFTAAFLVTILLLIKTRRSKRVKEEFCTRCGAKLELGSKFCGKCGAQQEGD
jgi:ribosomal protein L40E